jgi:oligopeptide/dipeptide ABC transporter ATP-binding protein
VSEPILDLKSVGFDYGALTVFDGLDFAVARGELVVCVGPSGCGKSTLLSLLGGHLKPTRGELLRRGVSRTIYQSGGLFPWLTVRQNIAGGLPRGTTKDVATKKVDEWLEITRLKDFADHYAHQLSGGMRQRALMAMALASSPRLLVADEPTTALDVTVQAQVLDLVRGFPELGLVWVSHDLGVIAGLAHRVVVMYAGSVVEEGDVRQVFHAPTHPYTRGLLDSVPRLRDSARPRLRAIPGLPPDLTDLPPGCPFYDRCAQHEDVCRTERPPLVEAAPGHRAACWVEAPPPEDSRLGSSATAEPTSPAGSRRVR